VGTFIVVSLGTWSALEPLSLRRRPESKTVAPFAQDDMSTEYHGRAEAGADCRRTTS
jgi:hypothetical protein